MLGWWYWFFLTFVAKIATIPGISLFIWSKELAKHIRNNRNKLYISVIHLSLCYFYVCSDGLSVKVFAFKSIRLTSRHDSHLLYTRHVYRHLLSCCWEWVPRFSYDETKGSGICFLVSKYTATVLFNKNGEENGFFNFNYFNWYPLGSSQGPLLIVTMPSAVQDHITNLEKGKIIVCPPSHPLSQTQPLSTVKTFFIDRERKRGREKEKRERERERKGERKKQRKRKERKGRKRKKQRKKERKERRSSNVT